MAKTENIFRFVLLVSLISMRIHSMESNQSPVKSLYSLTVKEISNRIAVAAEKKVPLVKVNQMYFDSLPICCEEDVKKDFIHKYGFEQKIMSINAQENNRAPVSCLAENNSYLYSGSHDGSIKILDKNNGICLKNLSMPNLRKQIFSINLDKKMPLLYSGSADEIKVWNLQSNSCVSTLLEHKGNIWTVKKNERGDKLYSGSSDSTIKIWDPERFQCLATLEDHKNQVTSIIDNENQIYSGSHDSTIKIWDTRTNKYAHSIEGQQDKIWSLMVVDNASKIFSGGTNNSIKSWDMRTNTNVDTYSDHKKYVFFLTPGKSGKIFYSGSRDHTIKIWDVDSNKCINTLDDHQRPVWSVIESSNSNHLYSGSEDRTVKIWQLPSFEDSYNNF